MLVMRADIYLHRMKRMVRRATQEEMKEYDERRKEAEEWYNGGGFLG